MKVLIITGGNIDDDFAFSFLSDKNYDEVIAVDGGLAFVDRAQAVLQNFKLTHLVGDFDTIASDILEKYIHQEDICVHQYVPEKDYTDLELALKKAMDLNAKNAIIIGGIGGRLDHTIANIQLLANYTEYFNELIMMDGRNKCFVLNSTQKTGIDISADSDSYISLFSLSEQCSGVSISGVKYPLNDHTLTNTFPLGVSNEFKEKNAALCIKGGTLLVVISKK